MEKEIKYCNHEGTEKDPCECEVVEKEFNLSEKRRFDKKIDQYEYPSSPYHYPEKDIKEFIKRLKENEACLKGIIQCLLNLTPDYDQLYGKDFEEYLNINKLAGEKLNAQNEI